jgi:hypothetical protein
VKALKSLTIVLLGTTLLLQTTNISKRKIGENENGIKIKEQIFLKSKECKNFTPVTD